MGGTTRSAATEVEVAGRTVRLTSPDRVIFPERGFTKADVFHYYVAVGEGIMRALADRPLGNLISAVRSHGGTPRAGTRFWKNISPSMPSGKRCNVVGRSRRARMMPAPTAT